MTIDTSPATAPARAEGLLRFAEESLPPPTITTRAARRALCGLLGRMTRDRLEVIEADGSRMDFGSDRASLRARIHVHDPRAWWAVAREGSIGLGRGYIEGWWSSPDPVEVVRVLIRNIARFDELRIRWARVQGPIGDGLRRLLPRRGKQRNKEDIASHYDISNEFFALFLDETMTYSSAVFPTADASLADASNHKYDRLLAKLGIDSSHDVLEIGTGWGGFALRSATETGCKLTTTTVSDQQLAEARRRVHQAGLGGRVTLLDRDWRDLRGSYDRVVSIEMIEAVDWRDHDRFFATIERCLAPDGMVGIQAICVPDRRFDAAKTTEDFIRRFVFPGGFLPSVGAIHRSVGRATRLQVLDVEDLTAHYAETLNRWRANFGARLEEVRALGLDERFCRLWEFYLSYCEAGFTERQVTVNQLVLVGPEWRPDGLSLRPL